MPRYFIELLLKGSTYSGWHLQDNANSVQSEINKALSVLCGPTTYCTGCGRTDKGVYPLQFFAHFDTERMEDEWCVL